MRVVGYARKSTDGQLIDAQADELRAAGCAIIFEETGSGADRSRPILARVLREIDKGDVLTVVRIDRLARSVSHLLEVIETLSRRGAYFRSLRDPIETTSPQGMFSLQVLGAVAQLERCLIIERTKAGLRAAMARGAKPGNPGLRNGDLATIRKITKIKAEAFRREVLASAPSWLPVVLKLRPAHAWSDVVRVLNANGAGEWTDSRLRRAARVAVRAQAADPAILKRKPMAAAAGLQISVKALQKMLAFGAGAVNAA